MNTNPLGEATALAKTSSAPLAERQRAAVAQVLTQSTPSEEIRTRPGKGGKQLKYTDGAYVIRTLNHAFEWDWDFEIDDQEVVWWNERPFEVRCRGKLTVRFNGKAIVKTQFGSQPIEMLSNGVAPISIGDAYKGAGTDALKKCASLLGIALDLYDSDSDVNTGHTSNSKTQQNGQSRQQQATSGQNNGDGQQNGQQATTAKGRQLQALQKALEWSDKELLDTIFKEFALSAEVVAEAIDGLPVADQSSLIQKLQAELQSRARK